MDEEKEIFLPGLEGAIGKALKKWLMTHRLGVARPGEGRAVVQFFQQYAATLAWELEGRRTSGELAMPEEEFLEQARTAWARRAGAERKGG